MYEEDAYICTRCSAKPMELSAVALPTGCAPEHIGTMSDAMCEAVRRCIHCLSHDGFTIDRAHVEHVHTLFGVIAVPLEPWLASRARIARPELWAARQLAVDIDATLVHPAENWQRRLDVLVKLQAPDVVIEEARIALADAMAREIRLDWDRVAPWPSPGCFPGTRAFGQIAREMAEATLPALIGDQQCSEIMAAIDQVTVDLIIDSPTLALRHTLFEASEHTEDVRLARGLELSVRFLDELGHTDLRTNQDTLVDDCYFTLRSVGLLEQANKIYQTWLNVAVPRAWQLRLS